MLCYINQYISVLRCSYSDIADTEFTVKGLQEGKEYEFRVAAVNKAGPGDFSEATDRIKAQPPPGKLFKWNYMYYN